VASLRKSKRGLSGVVATLILLVVSVLLAGFVTYYATNLAKTSMAAEEVEISKVHIWANSTTGNVAALVVQCIGDRDIIIDKITVRGVESAWSDTYTWKAGVIPLISDLSYAAPSGVDFSDKTWNVTIEGSMRSMTEPSADIDVVSSQIIVIYIVDPDDIVEGDIGATVSITVYTDNYEYIEEVIVEASWP